MTGQVIELGDFFAARMARNVAARLISIRPLAERPFSGFLPGDRVFHTRSYARGEVIAFPPEDSMVTGWLQVRWANGAETWVELCHLRLDRLSSS